MTRAIVIGVVLLTAALLQTTLFPFVSIAGFRPDLLLLAAVAFALRDGVLTGVKVGFVAGLLADLLVNGSAVGVQALITVGVAYGVGAVRPYLAQESVSAPLLVAFVAGVVGTAGFGVLSRLLGDQRFVIAVVLQTSVFVGLYNTLLAPVVVGVVTHLSRRFPIERALRV